MSELNDLLGTPISFVLGEETFKLQRFCPAIEEAHSEWLMLRVLKELQKRRKWVTDDDYAAAFVKITEHSAIGKYTFTSENFQDSLASATGTKHIFYQCLKVHHPKLTEADAYRMWEEHKTECALALAGIWGKGVPAAKRANSPESSDASSTTPSSST